MRFLEAEALKQIFADIIAAAVEVGEVEGGPIGTRPCIVNGKGAKFHRWSERCEMIDGSAAPLKWTAAIIEYEDGQVAEVDPYDVRFLDRHKRKYTEREDTRQ